MTMIGHQDVRQPSPRPVPVGPDALSIEWEIEGVRFAYRGADRAAIDNVTLQVSAASCTALIGPNGSGKSTLLRLLLGAIRPNTGRIDLAGRPLGEWSRRDLARRIGVVAQHEEITFPVPVREFVAMGRYPHLGALRSAGAHDRAAVETAMGRCHIDHLADRALNSLSGGERQRARLARALAQEPAALALDEPTVALDIAHEMAIFELLRDRVSAGATVLVATHNINLAARYADRLVLLNTGRVIAAGAPSAVLREDVLTRVFEWPLRVLEYPGPGPDTGAVQVTPLSLGAGTNRELVKRSQSSTGEDDKS